MCGTCVADPDTFVASEDYLGVFGRGTRLAMPKTNLRTGLLVIEVRFRGYWGSPGLRGPWASGMLAMGRTDGL